jgi:hypothetical protein
MAITLLRFSSIGNHQANERGLVGGSKECNGVFTQKLRNRL